MQKRRFWGWGYEDSGPDEAQLAGVRAALGPMLGMEHVERREPPTLDEVELRAPRVQAPDKLASKCSIDPFDRASHSYGKSYRDLVRAFARNYENPPDLVAFPETEADVVQHGPGTTSQIGYHAG